MKVPEGWNSSIIQCPMQRLQVVSRQLLSQSTTRANSTLAQRAFQSLMGANQATMISQANAIKGRKEEIKVTNKHFVTGNPIKAPFDPALDVAVFATGCFWGTEKAFWRLPGVSATAVGYIGGYTENPTYQEVCSGQTGHTEAVQVVYDQEKISFVDLLRLHWQSHDPTQGMGQGNDRGSQYRSGIYVNKPEHTAIAEASKVAYEKALKSEGKGTGELITTEIKAGETFFHAEESHQQYLAKPGNRQYCSAQPTEVQLPDFAEWAPADLKEKYAPKFPDVFWAEHGPKPLCTIAGPHSQIKWPPA